MPWKKLSCLKTARSHPAVTVVNNRIYAIGGGGPSFKSLSSVECYDIASGKWSMAADMPTCRSGSVAVAFNEKIYVIGGGFKKPDGRFCFLPTVEIFNIKENSWDKGPDMLQSHDYPAVTIIDDEIYIIAGHHPDATEGGPKTDPGSSFCEKWQTGTGAWQKTAPVSVPRFGPTAAVINGEIWAMGGVALSSSGFNNYDIIEIYNPARDEWRTESSIKLAWPAAAHSSVMHGGNLYLMGGYSGRYITDRVSVSKPAAAARFEDIESLPAQRAAMGCVACNNTLFCVGGWEGDGTTPVNTIFSLSL